MHRYFSGLVTSTSYFKDDVNNGVKVAGETSVAQSDEELNSSVSYARVRVAVDRLQHSQHYLQELLLVRGHWLGIGII